jgi:3-ketosteroid 9alpha-monooxygenase subunit B
MKSAPDAAGAPPAVRDHGFHELRIARVVRETAEASTFVLDVPDALHDAYAYRSGQFLTFRVSVDGATHLRSYSMSSSPAVDDELRVTVKRVPGGVVSNWMNDVLAPGDAIEATCPAGVFCLTPRTAGIVAYSGGSGITPVISIVKDALATTTRTVRLLYANRDRDAVIFAAELDELTCRYGERFTVDHHLDEKLGFVDAAAVSAFATDNANADHYLCGPGPFMDVVETALLGDGVEPGRIHIERFTPLEPSPSPPVASTPADAALVTVEHGGRMATAEHRAGTTILQMARQMGMAPPYSCEAGSCATCMARIVDGTATMRVNNALTADEVDEGWVLTCQALPASPRVHIVYE